MSLHAEYALIQYRAARAGQRPPPAPGTVRAARAAAPAPGAARLRPPAADAGQDPGPGSARRLPGPRRPGARGGC